MEVIKIEFMWMNINSTQQSLQLDYADYHCSLLKWKSSCHYLILVSKCCLGVGSNKQVWVAFPAHFTGIANATLVSLLLDCTLKGFT